MAQSDDQLRVTTRKAYERSRLRAGLVSALPIPVLAMISLIGEHHDMLTWVVAFVAAASSGVLVRRGGPLANGARIGLVAGLVPFTASLCSRDAPHIMTRFGHMHGCVLACGMACAVMTLVLSATARKQGEGATKQWLAATWTMLTVAMVACACVGIGGVALLVGMVVIATMPIAAISGRFARA